MRLRKRWCGVSGRCWRRASTFWAPAAAVRRITSARSAAPWTRSCVPGIGGGREPNMKIKLCDVNAAAGEKLPAHTGDKSGVGVHYTDAYIKPMNLKLPDGTPVRCKRKGLKIVLSAGGKKGEGLLRRLDAGPDPVVMLDAALQEAARAAGIELTVEDGSIFVGL